MKLPCAVTRDLLPLYAEKMVEAETKELIEQHLTDCPECRKKLSELETGMGMPVDSVQPLQTLKKEIRKRRRCAAVIAALCVFIGVYTYFFHTTSMKFVPWQEGLIEVARVETIHPADADNGSEPAPEADAAVPAPTASPAAGGYAGKALILNVSGFISGFQEHAIVEDDGSTTVLMQAISADPASDHPSQSYQELTYYPVPDRLIYGFEGPQKLLWGTPLNGGTEALPRLALAYYLILAAAAAGGFGLAWAVFRKWNYGWILRQLFFVPISYILSHLLLKGMHTASFFIERDMTGILLMAIALYALLSFAWQVFLRRRKEE